MSCRGVYFAISQGEADKLLNATADDDVLSLEDIAAEDEEQG